MAKVTLSALVSASQNWLKHSLTTPSSAVWTSAALGGCLAELSGAGASPLLTVAFGLVHQVQQCDQPVAWITSPKSTFFPPDVAAGGVDLSALPVIRLATFRQCLRAADQLARSGAFGLLVIDLGDCIALPLAVQTRLAEQAITHNTLILFLTTKTEQQPSLGSLVAIRGQARLARHENGRFVCQVSILKDKRHGPGWANEEWCRGPDGMC